MSALITGAYAQKSKKQVTGYAITADQKGRTGWREVRLVDISTGEELKTIYEGNQEIEILNARTGKAVVKKDESSKTKNLNQKLVEVKAAGILDKSKKEEKPVYTIDGDGNLHTRMERKVVILRQPMYIQSDKPFATNSAAMAYDAKHERLYYTPMNIAQLRYIDLKSKTPKVYYFENEKFGSLSSPGDVPNQITRMVIASDGNGYALSNDARHLTMFTTGKKPVITDLGSLSDDPANGTNSIHSPRGYGGDMIADRSKNLYLITANKNVFKVSIESKVATWIGSIQGLPKGFSTNGAMVEDGSKVIVASSESTLGYFRFDLSKISEPAEQVSTGTVFNASDLANGTLASSKKKKDKEIQEEKPLAKEEAKQANASRPAPTEINGIAGLSVYPNPVTNGFVRIAFGDQPEGKYSVQFLDMSGKLIASREVAISNKQQVEEFNIPELSIKGTYFVKVNGENNRASVIKVVVQ